MPSLEHNITNNYYRKKKPDISNKIIPSSQNEFEVKTPEGSKVKNHQEGQLSKIDEKEEISMVDKYQVSHASFTSKQPLEEQKFKETKSEKVDESLNLDLNSSSQNLR